jgi:hypothetical protein
MNVRPAGGPTALTDIPATNSLRGLVARVFHGQLWEFSPVRVAPYIRGTLLCAGSSFDQVIPQQVQLAAIRAARPHTLTMLLAGAPTPGGPSFSHPANFVHASVTAAARRRFRTAVVNVLAGAVAH